MESNAPGDGIRSGEHLSGGKSKVNSILGIDGRPRLTTSRVGGSRGGESEIEFEQHLTGEERRLLGCFNSSAGA